MICALSIDRVLLVASFTRRTEKSLAVPHVDNSLRCRIDLTALRADSLPRDKPRSCYRAKNGWQSLATATALQPSSRKLKLAVLTHVGRLRVN